MDVNAPTMRSPLRVRGMDLQHPPPRSLALGREILAGDTEPRQVDLIYKLCGVPDPESWPGLARLEAYRMLPPKQKYTPQFKQRFAR